VTLQQGLDPRPYLIDDLSINLAFVTLHMIVSRRSPVRDRYMHAISKMILPSHTPVKHCASDDWLLIPL
jgi:hypothetical protein